MASAEQFVDAAKMRNQHLRECGFNDYGVMPVGM